MDHFGGSEEEGLQWVREVVGGTNQPRATAKPSGDAEVGLGMGTSLEDFARLLPAPDDVAGCRDFPMLEVRDHHAVLCCAVL